MGYMASGKSHTIKWLYDYFQLPAIDLDIYIEKELLNQSISSYIAAKGELAFRKVERSALLSLVNHPKLILATGGGTPCYYNNMEVLKKYFLTIYLDVPIKTLADRLRNEKDHRPLIAHLPDHEIEEFIAKHLFERRHYYNQAHLTVKAQDATEKNIIELIKTNI